MALECEPISEPSRHGIGQPELVRAPAPTEHFLRVPPFPGAKVRSFGTLPTPSVPEDGLCALVRRLRVGGTYWGKQPKLEESYVLVRSAAALPAVESSIPKVLWSSETVGGTGGAIQILDEDCDPWHMLSGAKSLITTACDHDLLLIAAISGVPVALFNPLSGESCDFVIDPETAVRTALGSVTWQNPFTDEPMTTKEAIELCGFWRRLIDRNRDIKGGLGFAPWKQSHVAPLLWGGSSNFHFMKRPSGLQKGDSLAVWRARASGDAIASLQHSKINLIEVEDGFLRSQGLGADCIPPLSITVDRLRPHFDPSGPSELEALLHDGAFDPELLERARKLRAVIVENGLGKYDRGFAPVARRVANRRHILVPGQVEDDRAIQIGGCGLVSNLELLSRVRARAADAYILYKPHPDVIAGHRRGAIAQDQCLAYADEVVTDVPIASLIAMVDEVHVNTSLTGFEALLREKAVTTYGVPFYAGWGLTTDLGAVPDRRQVQRTLDELVAAALLLYPRYIDPVSGLPCEADLLVDRLKVGASAQTSWTVAVRRLQGKLMRPLRGLWR